MKSPAILICLLTAITVSAQHHDMPMPADSSKVSLESGLGPVHHPVSTKNREAQAFFDQGLAYIYAFNHDEAVRSFKHAAELDPDLAMAYWGVALARGSNYNWNATSDQLAEAFDNLQKALARATKTSASDRAYIEALSKRYSSDAAADQSKLAAAYSSAMKGVVKRFSADLDAATLYAESLMNLHPWQLWSLDGKPAEGTLELVSVLEGVLKRNPRHPGANHYYIHAVEASPHPERAVPSARRLAQISPGAGHLVHMPSHIYIRTGDYFAANRSNADAAKVDEKYLKKVGGPNFYSLMYYNHNIHFLAATGAMMGRWGESIQRARQLEASTLPMVGVMPMVQLYTLYPMVSMIRFRKWNEIKKVPQPEGSTPIITAFWHFARGMAFAGSKDEQSARQELKALRDAIPALPADIPMGNNSSAAYFGVAEKMLSGRIAIMGGKVDEGIELLTQAANAASLINYNEPPDWDLPVAEFLGPALLANKRYADAEKVYKAELSRHPNNGRALFGLAEAFRLQKKTADARKTSLHFRKSWREADTPFTNAELYQ